LDFGDRYEVKKTAECWQSEREAYLERARKCHQEGMIKLREAGEAFAKAGVLIDKPET
jgi:hypothetical protein